MIDTRRMSTFVGTENGIKTTWVSSDSLGHCFDADLVEDEAGGYVATVAQLPGVISEGNDLESAVSNIIEAFLAAIETYGAEGIPIPWREPLPKQEGAIRLRVTANA